MCQWEKRPQQKKRKYQDEQKSFFFCPTTVKLLSKAWIGEASWRSCVNITQMTLFSPRGVTRKCMNGCARDETSTLEADDSATFKGPSFCPFCFPSVSSQWHRSLGLKLVKLEAINRGLNFQRVEFVVCLFFAYFVLSRFHKNKKNLKTDQLWNLLYL